MKNVKELIVAKVMGYTRDSVNLDNHLAVVMAIPWGFSRVCWEAKICSQW